MESFLTAKLKALRSCEEWRSVLIDVCQLKESEFGEAFSGVASLL